VLVPAAILMAAMVPAIAAVYPGDPPPRPASSDLKAIIIEMQNVEERLEPHLERIEDIEIDIAPSIEINEEAITEIEVKMRPYLDRIADMEIDMEPFTEKIALLEDQIEDLVLHVQDGTLEEVQRQIHEQLAEHMEKIEAIHIDMEPFHAQMEELHAEIEPLHEELEKLHVDMEPFHLEMERFHDRMEDLHHEMEPLHEELELLEDRLESALAADVAAELRDHLGAVTTFAAPFDEAAARIVDGASVRVHDEVVRIRASRREVRQILNDLMKPHRVGLEEAFDAAVDNAADALSPLEIAID
jgi:chromosome segregation ATPase